MSEWVPKVGDRVWIPAIVSRNPNGEWFEAYPPDDDRSFDACQMRPRRPADEPSVDEMFESVCPARVGEVVQFWRTQDGGVIVQRLLEDEPCHVKPTLTEALRALHDVVTKETDDVD